MRPSRFLAVTCASVALLFSLARTSPAQTESGLYSFTGGNDGGQPEAGLVFDSVGNIYGRTPLGGKYVYGTTLSGGGASVDCGLLGCGVVYQLTPPSSSGGAWSENILHAFVANADGIWPLGELVFDKAGALYGTTEVGGLSGDGTVFQVSPPAIPGGNWTETVLHSFTGGESDGNEPICALVFDYSGN